VPFFFVSAVIWEKKISRKTFYVALTYENVPPGQIVWFLKDTLVRKIDWGNWVRVRIGGVASMTGYRLSVVPKIKK